MPDQWRHTVPEPRLKNLARALPILLLLMFFGVFENANWACAAQPPDYNRQANFTDWSTAYPSLPHDGTDMDDEFNAVKTTLDAILHNLALIQRDDGQLANHSVGIDQLKDEVAIGFNPVGTWLTATEYHANDAVWHGDILYRATTLHTSGVFADDLADGDWEVLVDFSGYVSATAASAASAAASAATATAAASGVSASQAAAAASASAASSSASAASSSQTAAASSASSAATSLAAIQASWRGAWLTSTSYAVGDKVSNGGSSYIATVAHTSGGTTEPGVGGSYLTVWNVLAAKGAAGAGAGDMVAANNLSDVVSAATARTNLGLAIGTNVQAYDAELAAQAGLVSAADRLPYYTGSGTASLATYTAAARTFDAAATAAAERTAMGVVIGTDVQAQDGELSALAGLTSAADKLPYFTGSGTAAVADFTAAGRALVDDASASAQRTTLGLGTGALLVTDTDGTLAANSDSNVATQKAVKTYVDAHAGGGDLTLASTGTASASAALDFTGLSSSCSAYKFIITNIRPATDGVDFYFRTSTDGGSTFAASTTNYIWQSTTTTGNAPSSSTVTGGGTGGASMAIHIADNVDNGSSGTLSGELTIYQPSDATAYKYVEGRIMWRDATSGSFNTVNFNGIRASAADVDAVRFLMSSGNITSGKIYGYCLSSS